MEPKRLGRTLGIAVRVAARMVNERRPQAPPAGSSAASGAADERQTAGHYREPRPLTAGIRQGARNFGNAFFGPFLHAGNTLWLEITGLFFGLFALFFAENVYRYHGSWRQGPNHPLWLLYLILTLLFSWFSVSSFHRARLKAIRRRSR